MSVNTPLFSTLAIIGPGLIGSSILRRVRQSNIATYLIAVDRSPEVLQRVRDLSLVDHTTPSIAEGVHDADLVIICTPVGAISSIAQEALSFMKPGSILSDVASVRSTLTRDILPHLPNNISYVPAHPMAGTEYSGPDAGFSTLFDDRWCLLVPPENTPQSAIDLLDKFWRCCGARTRQVSAQYHDHICAIVSHLPHLLAFTMCDTADRLSSDLRADVLDYAASGFRDFTRIAASDPTMWHDIFLANREIILQTLERFQAETSKMADAIRTGDNNAIIDRIERGRRIRLSLLKNKQA